jgi:hypothetical protein
MTVTETGSDIVPLRTFVGPSSAEQSLAPLNDPTQLRRFSPVDFARRTKQRRKLMVEIDLTAAAYELVRDGVNLKARKGGMYRVLMPRKLAARLDAARASGEAMSDVILRLAQEAGAPADPRPLC